MTAGRDRGDPRGLHLHIDGASGIAGDMTLGALFDLGVPVAVVEDALDRLGVGRARLQVGRVVKSGIAAVNVQVDARGELGGGHRHGDPRVDAPVATPAADSTYDHGPGLDHTHDHGNRRDHRDHDHEQHAHEDAHHGDHVDLSHDHAHGLAHEHAHGLAHEHAHEPAHEHAHAPAHDHAHAPAHDHAHAYGAGDEAHGRGHAHHHYADIRARLLAAGLGPAVLARALDMFDRVARAEAKLHGTTVDAVAFHEVGAIDSIVDIVGTAAALAWLAPTAVTCSEVAMGHGTLRCAHGVLPVPAPAALEILREAGGVMTSGGVARELTTPTGAAILAHAVTAWTPAPTGAAVAVGWGAGDMELADRANVVRITAIAPRVVADALWRLEANIDDMSPELAAHAIDAALAAGAVDAWWTPITMKKGRPALLFAALAPDGARDRVVAAVLRETTSIGIRFDRVDRTMLARAQVRVETEYGPIAIKVARDDAGNVVNAAPEHDDCAAAASRAGAPLKDVYAAAVAAWRSARS